MKNCKILMKFRENSVLIEMLANPLAPLGWSDKLSNLTVEIVGIPDNVEMAEVLQCFKETVVGPNFEELGFRLPFSRIGRGAWVSPKKVEEILKELGDEKTLTLGA